MLTREKMEAMKYLKKEFTQFQNNPLLQIGLSLGFNSDYDRDYFHWRFTLLGPYDIPMKEVSFF